MPMRMTEPTYLQSGLQGLCPRCGAKTLFAGMARFAPTCSACRLDFAAFNVGDGPAAFLTFFLGALIVGLAIWLELSIRPPFWVHILLWLPITIVAVMGSLRICKGMLINLEYRNAAREGRIKRP
jgi:uncharacterized protein (DUF983 family)